MNRIAQMVSLVSLFALVACSAQTTDKKCTTPLDCGDGYTCEDGVCVESPDDGSQLPDQEKDLSEEKDLQDGDGIGTDDLLPDGGDDTTTPDDDAIDDDATDQWDQSDDDTIVTDDDTTLTDDDTITADDDDAITDVTPDIDNAPPACVDLCVVGNVSAEGTCTLWNDTAQQWVTDIEDGNGHMHNRARNYLPLLRNRLMPEGGIFRTQFSDTTYTQATMHTGRRDSPIWTGTYLAAEAMRSMVTGDPDAAAQIDRTVRVMDRWWRIVGDRGYLARYAAPADSAPEVVAIFDYDPGHPYENHKDHWFEGDIWHWKGDISRDQYQGTLLGFSFAYEATQDEALKEIIRSNVVNFIEQLMEVRSVLIDFSINGVTIPYTMNIQYAVYNSAENDDNGRPFLAFNTDSGEEVSKGFLNFWTNPSIYLRQLPGFGWVPDFYLRTQAIQLAGMFRVALQVTDGVPAYAARRAAILQHYNDHFEEWLDLADGYTDTSQCGASYHGFNIAFEPLYNWVRLEDDPSRELRIQDDVLRNKLWAAVDDHKNVFFAYIYASQAAPGDNTGPVIAAHNTQLAQFPAAPLTAPPVDNTAKYPADSSCEGLSSVAIDVADRVPSCFMWERNPWELIDPGIPNFLYPGVDYLVAYWMARHYGFIGEDAPNTCLRWRP
ncbi:MAG TPA: hypothetical protein P5077_06085 [bacterium]|nr:hypothetical protein [bacterium]